MTEEGTEQRVIKVLLADDHAVVRSGLRALLAAEPDLKVVGEAASGREAVEKAETLRPDVVVMDISMPDMDGLEATRLLRERGVPAQVVILTVHGDDEYLFRALEAGASGYVVKSASDTDLLQAIRLAARGQAFLYPSAVRRVLSQYLQGRQRPGRPPDDLSPRELEVLRLTAAGYTNQEIARQLFISPKTVDTYRQRIMEKLGLQRRSELVRYALKKGLLREQ
ncbi:MAG TPA: response regulator transcription factor [Dehalococcoidia bacterium]|nr:response regulator transcription factor [Dehalococcoidia bacterium]